MSRIFAKGMSLGLALLLLLALPMGVLGEQTAPLTNAPMAAATTWTATLPIEVVVTDESGNTLEGTLDIATDDVESLTFAGAVDLVYEYGATNMPASILFHALINMNERALLRIEGSSLENEVTAPGTYTATYTYQGAGGEPEVLVCTVRVRGAIVASVTIADHEIPLSDGKGGTANPAPTADAEPQEEDVLQGPVPVVVVH